MEGAETICVGEWNSSFNSDEADFMAKLFGNCSLPNAAAFWGGDESNSGIETATMFSFSLGSNSSNLMAMDFCTMDGSNNVMDGDDVSNDEPPHSLQEDKMSSRKRPRVLGESQRSKKLKKRVQVIHDSNNVVLHRQSSSGCLSEDDSSVLNSSSSSKRNEGQKSKRASRGSATDPQSLYARKRRERINERLRILQNLVPNGTKVDISTMLEEAVQYVKFLQLQIKLLSSDDMWMYAPIAYNGMGIGLDFNIPSPKPQSYT